MQPRFSHQNDATLFDPLEIVLAKIGLGRRFYHTAHRNHASTADRRSRKNPVAMSLLQCSNRRTVAAQKFMTQ